MGSSHSRDVKTNYADHSLQCKMYPSSEKQVVIAISDFSTTDVGRAL